MRRQIQQLDGIYEMMSYDLKKAATKLRQFLKNHKTGMSPYVKAKAQLLTMTIDISIGTYKADEKREKELISFFLRLKKYDDAARTLLILAKLYLIGGNIEAGEKLVNEVKTRLLDKITIKTEIVYLTRVAFIHIYKLEVEEQLDVCLQALAKLNLVLEKDNWYYEHYSWVCSSLASIYNRNQEFEKGKTYLDELTRISNEYNFSKYGLWIIYHAWSNYHTQRQESDDAISWYHKMIALIKDEDNLSSSLYSTYVNAAFQSYWVIETGPPLSQERRKYYIEQQEIFMHGAGQLLNKYGPGKFGSDYTLCMSRLEYQKGNYKKAIDYLTRAIATFQKNGHKTNELQCYREGHIIYHAWGAVNNDADLFLKAYQFLKKANALTEEEAMVTNQQKLAAVKMKYELKNKALSQQLLQQQIESMNKEIQLTAIHLHEKIMVLDDLKVYVRSLKKKETETRNLINTIAQRIESVKITEQDKRFLQQKFNINNQQLSKALSTKYPALSELEIRICGLIQTGLTNKELSKLYGQTEKSYEQHRYRIKKKMKLNASENLVKHLLAIADEFVPSPI